MDKCYGSSRNWNEFSRGTNLFCETLADPVINFIFTLELVSLKTTSTKELFDKILAGFLEIISI